MARVKRTTPASMVDPGQPKASLARMPAIAPQKPKTSRIGNLGEWAHPPKRKKK